MQPTTECRSKAMPCSKSDPEQFSPLSKNPIATPADASSLNAEIISPCEPSDSETKSKPLAPVKTPHLSKNHHPPGLYLVATPIGNLSDISLRALELLNSAHVIACEDRRITSRLLDRHGISKPLVPYHEHNADTAGPELIRRLKDGAIVALVSDAGTPLLSDPGYKLVQHCLANDIHLSAIPGASSILMSLILSGLPSDRFFFNGFLSPKKMARIKALTALTEIPGTLIFLESPKRLAASLADMNQVLGPRPAAVARELTKLYEQVKRGTLDQLAQFYAQSGSPKGEITVVVAPPIAAKKVSIDDIDRALIAAFEAFSVRGAVQHVCKQLDVRKKIVYERALVLDKKRS